MVHYIPCVPPCAGAHAATAGAGGTLAATHPLLEWSARTAQATAWVLLQATCDEMSALHEDQADVRVTQGPAELTPAVLCRRVPKPGVCTLRRGATPLALGEHITANGRVFD
jgi:hypothetical protein